MYQLFGQLLWQNVGKFLFPNLVTLEQLKWHFIASQKVASPTWEISTIIPSLFIRWIISFPNLVYIGNNLNLSPSAGANPQTLNLNSLQTIFGTYVNIQMSNLTSFALPSLKYISNGCNIYFYTALDQTSVDNVLVALAALDGTNGTFIWSVGTINISGGNAAPGATGVTAKDVLIARGISVSTN